MAVTTYTVHITQVHASLYTGVKVKEGIIKYLLTPIEHPGPNTVHRCYEDMLE